MNQEGKNAPSIKTIVITGDAVDKIEKINGEYRHCVGKDAIKVTIEIKGCYAAEDIIESLKDVFLRTTQCFERFL